MSQNLFITSAEDDSGKFVVALGVMEMLLRRFKRVGFFRPIITDPNNEDGRDDDIHRILSHFEIDMAYEDSYAFTTEQVSDFISKGEEDLMYEKIIEKYDRINDQFDFVLCEGTDFKDSLASYAFDINAEICNNLKSPVLLVVNADQKTVDETLRTAELALDSFDQKKCHIAGMIVNRPDANDRKAILERLAKNRLAKDKLLYSLPNEPYLNMPTVSEVANVLGAEVLYGHDQLHRHVHTFTVAAMQLRNFINHIEQGALIITPGDRADVIVACLASLSSRTLAGISGILLTGNLRPEDSIRKLIEGFSEIIPILSTAQNTFETATSVSQIKSSILPDDKPKIRRALSIFENNVDIPALQDFVIKAESSVVTPKNFEYKLIQKAKQHRQRIVLPEGEEDRILLACEELVRRNVVEPVLLGRKDVIREKCIRLGLHLDDIEIIHHIKSECFDDFVDTFFEMRKHRGITRENAHDAMCDVSTYGTMMVHEGQVAGMVSGSINSTASTIRPALQIIKTIEGASIVSSVFFMCLEDRVLVYGDCAVCANPNAQQLAEIAISSALTAEAFEIEPIVALLSYSTGQSGKGEDVDKVREATELAQKIGREKYPHIKIDGPIQYDAAVDPRIAKTKMPDSEVAGKATVYVFPDLNTGNNTYKAVQRSAGVVAIGPVLQGLNHPVNDLSRGCTVPDIINTVAITAIQAQTIQGLT